MDPTDTDIYVHCTQALPSLTHSLKVDQDERSTMEQKEDLHHHITL